VTAFGGISHRRTSTWKRWVVRNVHIALQFAYPLFMARFLFLAWITVNVLAQQTAKVNGIDMYFDSHGAGEPLVLLHGFNSSGQVWKPVLDEFARHYRVIVPDLRGHGASTNPSGEFTHRQSARDVYALLDHLGVQHFKAMGISTGGMTLLHMATSQRERIEAMVVIGATTYFPAQARAIMRKSTPESLTETQVARLRAIHKHGDEQIRMLRRQFYGFNDSHDDMMFTPPLLATIRARTLVIHGDRDAFFPVSIPIQMYESIPNSALWIVANANHVPIFQEYQPEFVRMALKFLSGP
jgi:pimeloyl-ACP methyl ester carboxylesterase